MVKVFYCYPDEIDYFNNNMSYETARELMFKGKGVVYTLAEFEIKFNNDEISDLGFIKFFTC